MKGPPLGPGGKDITWPDQVASRGRNASSSRNHKPQTSNLKPPALQPAATASAGPATCRSAPLGLPWVCICVPSPLGLRSPPALPCEVPGRVPPVPPALPDPPH